MKLFRWAAAGASAYVIYKYSIGKKAKGEKVFDSPEPATKPRKSRAAKAATAKAEASAKAEGAARKTRAVRARTDNA